MVEEKEKNMKKLGCFVLALVLSLSLVPTAFAANDDNDGAASPTALGTQTTHSWSYKYGEPTEKTKGSWQHIYTGEPAARTGETDSVSHSVSYGHSFTGTFGGNIKDKIQVEFGISFSKEEGFSISKNSASLNKGEYIKAYWMKTYDSYDVVQTDLQHTYGFAQSYPGGPYEKVDRYESVVSHVTVDKAIHPKIKIEYWKDGKKVRSVNSGDMLVRTEYYEIVDGEYHLVEG